jgi:Zn-dependent M28 family amino/carboxypeptidase
VASQATPRRIPFPAEVEAKTQEEYVKRFALIALGMSLAACTQGRDQAAGPDVALSGDSIREHMRVLSSDEYMGRGSGQKGGDMASQYVADLFKDAGLEPVNGSYFQQVPMVGYATDPTSVKLSFRGKGGTVTAKYLDDYVLNAGDPRATSAGGAAEVVFVGYGIDAPEANWNDFAGVDVKGKYILILVNDPPAPADEPDLFGGPAMTYYGRWTYKWEEAARQGALGALIVHETEPAGYPWSVVRGGRSGEQFSLPPDPSGPVPAGMLGWVTRDEAVKLLALGGLEYDALKAAAGRRGFVAVPTGVTATASLKATVRQVETRNVVGLLRGSQRPDEIVTLTSHYDHFGIGEPVNGDSIYNGAYDNASGTSMLIEIARGFASLPTKPARSLLFISTAAEEQGLLGSQWYAQSPLFPLAKTAGEINMDGANLWGETDDVTIFGEDRNGLGAFARARAAQMGLRIVPDQEPEKGYFFRSDHFPFAKMGVPALYIEHGQSYRGKPEGWGKQIQEDYTAHRYHAPSDEFSDDFVFDGAVQQGTLIFRIAWDIAQTPTWPNWNEGQEFKAARDAMMGGM